MAKMREVKKTAAKSTEEKVVVMMEIGGQMVPVTICKPMPAPKGYTARCQG